MKRSHCFLVQRFRLPSLPPWASYSWSWVWVLSLWTGRQGEKATSGVTSPYLVPLSHWIRTLGQFSWDLCRLKRQVCWPHQDQNIGYRCGNQEQLAKRREGLSVIAGQDNVCQKSAPSPESPPHPPSCCKTSLQSLFLCCFLLFWCLGMCRTLAVGPVHQSLGHTAVSLENSCMPGHLSPDLYQSQQITVHLPHWPCKARVSVCRTQGVRSSLWEATAQIHSIIMCHVAPHSDTEYLQVSENCLHILPWWLYILK